MFIMESSSRLDLKIIVVGDSGVGKSSLTKRFQSDDLELGIINSTIGVDYCVKDIVVDNYTIRLKIWDTAGQERFRSMVESYYRNAEGVVVVYDVTQRNSFDSLEYWINKAKSVLDNPVIIVVGNKIDRENRVVTRSEGLQYSKTKGALFMETSVLIRQGVGHVFEKLARKILQSGVLNRQREAQRLSMMDPSSYRNCLCGM